MLSLNQTSAKFVAGEAIVMGSATANFHSSYLKRRKKLISMSYSGAFPLLPLLHAPSAGLSLGKAAYLSTYYNLVRTHTFLCVKLSHNKLSD